MAIGVLAAGMYLALGSLATWWSARPWRREWTFLAMGVAIATGAVIGVVRFGLQLALVTGPVSAALAMSSLLIGSVFWAQVLGLPRPLALRLGIGLTSRQLEFSNRMRKIVDPLIASNNRAIDEPALRPAAVSSGRKRVARLRSVRTRDVEWVALRDDLAGAYSGTIDFLQADVPRERFLEHAESWRIVMARWKELEMRAAEDQRRLATPARRRRRGAIFIASMGISFALIGGAQLISRGLPSISLANLPTWLPLAEVAIGIGAIAWAVAILLGRAEP